MNDVTGGRERRPAFEDVCRIARPRPICDTRHSRIKWYQMVIVIGWELYGWIDVP